MSAQKLISPGKRQQRLTDVNSAQRQCRHPQWSTARQVAQVNYRQSVRDWLAGVCTETGAINAVLFNQISAHGILCITAKEHMRVNRYLIQQLSLLAAAPDLQKEDSYLRCSTLHEPHIPALGTLFLGLIFSEHDPRENRNPPAMGELCSQLAPLLNAASAELTTWCTLRETRLRCTFCHSMKQEDGTWATPADSLQICRQEPNTTICPRCASQLLMNALEQDSTPDESL